jgi:hypothetical protein
VLIVSSTLLTRVKGKVPERGLVQTRKEQGFLRLPPGNSTTTLVLRLDVYAHTSPHTAWGLSNVAASCKMPSLATVGSSNDAPTLLTSWPVALGERGAAACTSLFGPSDGEIWCNRSACPLSRATRISFGKECPSRNASSRPPLLNRFMARRVVWEPLPKESGL